MSFEADDHGTTFHVWIPLHPPVAVSGTGADQDSDSGSRSNPTF